MVVVEGGVVGLFVGFLEIIRRSTLACFGGVAEMGWQKLVVVGADGSPVCATDLADEIDVCGFSV